MNKYYKLKIHESNLEVEINFLPKNYFDKNKLYYDLLLLYYEINNITITYKNIIINKEESKNLISYNQYIKRIYITSV